MTQRRFFRIVCGAGVLAPAAPLSAAAGDASSVLDLASPSALWAALAGLLFVSVVLFALPRFFPRQRRDTNESLCLAHSADCVWMVNERLSPTYSNPATQSLFGVSAEAYALPPLSRFYTPEAWEAFTHAVAASKVAGPDNEPARQPLPLLQIRADGARIWTETVLAPIRDSRGVWKGLVLATRNRDEQTKAESQASRCIDQLRTIIEQDKDGLLVVDAERRIRLANAAAGRFLGDKPALLVGRILPQALSTGAANPIAPFIDINTEIELQTPAGLKTASVHSRTIEWESEKATLISLRDITLRKGMEKALRNSEARCRVVADHAYALETWADPEGRMLYVSPSCERITGYPAERYLGDPEFLEKIIHKDDLPQWRRAMSDRDNISGEASEFRLMHFDGRARWVSRVCQTIFDEDGTPLGLRSSLRDITERKLIEIQLHYQSLHDPLTGLANRTLCLDRIRQAIERAKRREHYFYAVAILNLDRFKVVNDSLGHAFGDRILAEVGTRISAQVRGLDTVARFGADEFAVFLEELSTPREAIQIVKRIHAALKDPFFIDAQEVRCSASIGVALSGPEYKSAEEFLRNANIAMNRSKDAGRDRYKIFSSKMHEQAVRRMTMQNDLRRGIEAREFFLHFQPILRLNDQTLFGFEALVRWMHPERGLVGPGEFIPVAEETGLIIDLGRFVLEEACSAMAGWRALYPGARDLFMSVNISGRQFSQTDLVDTVKRILEATAMPADRLKLELTETTIMEDAGNAREKLVRLKDSGITLSIDDFGTGYSSMSYLRQFPLDNLKIDLSFVRMMEMAPENIEIVKAIINLAHTLNLEVVAEGVENLLQRQVLASLGCEYAQGFLFSKPLPRDEVAAMLKALDRNVSDTAHARSA